jgi:hypothetical protein
MPLAHCHVSGSKADRLTMTLHLRLSLGLNRLTKLPDALYPKSFEFAVGSSSFKCSTLVADFLSPRIARLREIDPSVDFIELETKCDPKQFEEFLSLASGVHIKVTDVNRKCLVSIARELGNLDILSSLLQSDESYKSLMDIDTVLSQVHLKEELNLNCDREISFLASRFEEFCDSDLSDWNLERLYELFSHRHFQISNEDFLYSFVLRRAKVDLSFVSLLEFVHFELLSESSISQFIEDSSGFWSSLNTAAWMRICTRLLSQRPEAAKQVDRTAMRIFVDSLLFPTLWLDVTPRMSVHQLKEAITHRTSVPTEHQELSFNGSEMQDDTLGGHRVSAGSVLHLNVAVPHHFSIRIRLLDADTPHLTTEVRAQTTIAAIRAFASRSTRCPLGSFVLAHRDVVLEDIKTLTDYDITEDSELVMKLAPNDGGRQRELYQVFIKGLTQRGVFIVNVNAETRVRELQEMLAVDPGVPVHVQGLSYRGAVLNPDRTLGQYRIGRDATIDSWMRLAYAVRESGH